MIHTQTHITLISQDSGTDGQIRTRKYNSSGHKLQRQTMTDNRKAFLAPRMESWAWKVESG